VATVLQELGDLMDDLGEYDYDYAMNYYIDALDIRRVTAWDPTMSLSRKLCTAWDSRCTTMMHRTVHGFASKSRIFRAFETMKKLETC
jgi:hypothetical protein